MYQIRVLVNDRPVPVYHDYRNGTDWIEARDGVRYVVEIRNDNWKRILAVASVDGLNVINGKHEDSFTAPGYIIHGHGNIKIPGWKISADNVKEFYFTPEGSSYSSKLGANPANDGVIASAIFEEKEYYTWTNTSHGSSYWPKADIKYLYPPLVNQNVFDDGHRNINNNVNNIMFSSASTGASINVNNLTSKVEEKLATGSGEVVDFKTHKTWFGERVLKATLLLYYDTREGLIRRGINLDTPRSTLPRPFPNGEYCPDL